MVLLCAALRSCRARSMPDFWWAMGARDFWSRHVRLHVRVRAATSRPREEGLHSIIWCAPAQRVALTPARASIDISRIRRAGSLGAILSHYQLDAGLKRVGSQLAGCCPIHGGSNPRQFVVNLGSGEWHCFGDCNRGGGSLELVAEIEHLDVRGAALLVAEWFAIPSSDARAVQRHSKE